MIELFICISLLSWCSVCELHMPGHSIRVPWCRVIASFHHSIRGGRPAISCAFITIRRAISGAGDQLRLQKMHSVDGKFRYAHPRPPPKLPITLSSAMIYWRRKLERSSNKSNNSVALEEEIRKQASSSKAQPASPALYIQTCVSYNHHQFPPPPP